MTSELPMFTPQLGIAEHFDTYPSTGFKKNDIMDEDFGLQARITVWRARLADDRDVWERICRGDEGAFDALYRTQGPKVQMFLRRLLGNSQAAEDVMQETFAALWQHPNGFAAERGALRAYLFGAARKRAAAWWRKQGAPGEPVQSEPDRCATEMVSLVTDAVSRLPSEGRALIWLREVEGYSYDELAQILEIPAGTVASRLFAAREKLRNIWQAAPQEKKEGS